MYRHNYLTLSSALLALATLASCDDKDFGYTAVDIRAAAYSSHFTDLFGEVDPNHTWNMAQSVKVNINVPNASGYQLRILTEAPANREAVLLYQGMMSDEQLTANVDVVRGTRSLYVEMKSDLGTYLVDGYYMIDEESCVEVNKMMGTRAATTPPPACVSYTTTLNRWARVWSNTAAPGSPYQWDYGFVNRLDHFVSGVDVVPIGWIIGHDGSERPSGSSQTSDTRSISISDSHATINGSDISVSNCVVLQSTSNKAYMKYGYVDGQAIKANNNTTIHVPLAYYSEGNNQFTLIVQKKNDGNWENVKEEQRTINTKYSGSTNIVFEDAAITFQADEKSEYGIIIRFDATGTSTSRKYAVCAGCCVESPSWYRQIYGEAVDGWITFRDVRGGGLNLWSQNLKLRDGGTYRNNASNTVFKYRTFDVSLMSDGDVAGGVMGPFYMISGGDGSAVLETTEKIKYRDQFPLYGLYKSTIDNKWKGSPFREGENHIDPFFTDGNFHQATDFEMKKDAQVITLGRIYTASVQYDGSVSIKLVGIGTGWGNDVGYFYYPKSEEESLMRNLPNGEKALDFNKIPKVIIRKNMQSAISYADQPMKFLEGATEMAHYGLGAEQFSRYVDGCTALSMTSDEFHDLLNSNEFKRYENNQYRVKDFIDYLNQSGKESQKALAKDATFDAPIYKLPYYGWQEINGKCLPTGTPTYEWPADYVIGFFGIRTDGYVAAELSRIYTSSASVQRNYFNDLPRGSAFSYKGKNYIGLEDEWDYDNNDFLFEITGIQSVDPDITPEDDPVSDKTTQSWIIACEDLGGSWDYDFNDLVWAVTKEVVTTKQGSKEWGTTDLYFRALAAGGTLEAIVEYNSSVALDPNDSGWDENNWAPIGEIHNLVKRTNPTKVNDTYQTPTDKQINVTLGQNPSLSQVGDRIKLGSTIPTNSSNITMMNILSHFRVKVIHSDGTTQYVRNVSVLQAAADHLHDNHANLQEARKAPQFILLPNGWCWPGEAVCISDAYPGFTDWTLNRGASNWLNGWNAKVVQAEVIENPLK